MLAARELSVELPSKGGSWVNRHLQYTHGYGLAMCLAADKDDQGGPVFIVEDLPPKGPPDLTVSRPEIYYGTEMTSYQIVSTGVKEFDYPKGDQNVYTSYAGHGGVLLDSFWKKALFAWHQFDVNIVLSSYLLPQSRIQLWRTVQQSVSRSAPFLKLDRDPYLVVDQGRLFWIQDAYTVADGFPYSEPTDDGFSYIRNSVKVVVDAYEGDVRFYVVDPADPILRVYRAAFPGLFHSLDEMSPGLRQHLRYPQDLFEIQVNKFNTYHMTVPQVFYNREDVWASPYEKFGGKTIQLEPYYVLMKLPGENRLGFLLMISRYAQQPRQHDRLDRRPVGFPRLRRDDCLQIVQGQPHPWPAPNRGDDRSGHDNRAPAHIVGPARFPRDTRQSTCHSDQPVLSLHRTGVSAGCRDEHSAAQAGHRQQRRARRNGSNARKGPPRRLGRTTIGSARNVGSPASTHIRCTRSAFGCRASTPPRRLDRIRACMGAAEKPTWRSDVRYYPRRTERHEWAFPRMDIVSANAPPWREADIRLSPHHPRP